MIVLPQIAVIAYVTSEWPSAKMTQGS